MRDGNPSDDYAAMKKWLLANGACHDGRQWAIKECRDLAEVWDTAQPDWLVWVATRENVLLTDEQRKFARWCASRVLYLWNAPDIVRQYLATGDESLAAVARVAARAAARVAAEVVAGAVARVAARAAEWAALELEWDALEVKWNAIGAAGAAEMAAEASGVREAEWAAQAKYLRTLRNPFK